MVQLCKDLFDLEYDLSADFCVWRVYRISGGTRPGDREADMGFLCDRGSLLYLDVLVFSGDALVSFAVICSDPDSCQDIASRNCADWSSAVWHRHFCRTVCTDGMGTGLLQVFLQYAECSVFWIFVYCMDQL